MTDMFKDATAFNQDISRWDVSNVTNLTGFLSGATAFSTENLDKLLAGWSDINRSTGETDCAANCVSTRSTRTTPMRPLRSS